jgi:hypothetical protein
MNNIIILFLTSFRFFLIQFFIEKTLSTSSIMSCDTSNNTIKSITDSYIFYDEVMMVNTGCTSATKCCENKTCSCDTCNDIYDECETVASHCSELRSVDSFDSFNETDEDLLNKEIDRAKVIKHNRRQSNKQKQIIDSDFNFVNSFQC